MSSTIHSTIRDATNRQFSAEQKRSFAVAVALEIIAAKAAAEGTNLALEFENLSKYADQIQAALNHQ